MSTPHINANPGDFADICLLPGDPLRSLSLLPYKYLDVCSASQ